jgi:hypothetical protein
MMEHRTQMEHNLGNTDIHSRHNTIFDKLHIFIHKCNKKLIEWVKADEIQKFGCWSGADLYQISNPRKLIVVEQCQIFLEKKVTGVKQTKIPLFLKFTFQPEAPYFILPEKCCGFSQ